MPRSDPSTFTYSLILIPVLGISINLWPWAVDSVEWQQSQAIVGDRWEQEQLAQTPDRFQLTQQAKAVTVQINGASEGSGAIVGKSNNIYWVLTNWHVVKKDGSYTIRTADGQPHTILKKQRLIGLDVAILAFQSDNLYQIATLGDSNQLQQRQVSLNVSGHPSSTLARLTERPHQFIELSITGFLTGKDIEDGYEIILTGPVLPGMSGSPIFTSQGQLVAIYGAAPGYNVGVLYAIPINRVLSVAKSVGIDFDPVIARQSLPSSAKPSPTSSNNLPSITLPTSSPGNITQPEVRVPSLPITPSSTTDDFPPPVFPTLPTTTTSPTMPNVRVPSPTVTPRLSPSKVSVDLVRLDNLLQEQRWREADEETALLVIKLGGNPTQKMLDLEKIKRFPCNDLRAIDQLWTQHSDGKFGFSVQKRIFMNSGGNLRGIFNSQYQKATDKFGDRVGWKRNNQWISYQNLSFTLSAPPGHLPEGFAANVQTSNSSLILGGDWRFFYLFPRMEQCGL